jgi:endonuclease/exonuclease/phosphatase family metal-dependent hydrolase
MAVGASVVLVLDFPCAREGSHDPMHRIRGALPVLAVLLAAPALAASDVPVRGQLLRLRAGDHNPDHRSAMLTVKDAAIAVPLPDPRGSGASLVVHGGSSAGQCFVLAQLPPASWRPIRGDGARHGWRFRDRTGASAGVRRVVLRPGRLLVSASGGQWPCELSATERVPVTATFRVEGQRWCSAFGGKVNDNEPGRFRARGAPAPATCPDPDVTVAQLNILHGLFCPGTDNCRFADRAALFLEWVEAAGCPDVVTLQEVRDTQVPVLLGSLPSACGGVYQALYDARNRVDDAMILSRWPSFGIEVVSLYGGFRNVLHARIDHPLGPVDVFATHLGAAADGAQNACTTDCPPDCVAAGAATLRECQAVQVARLVEDRHREPTPAIIAGDFNDDPGSFVTRQLTMRGWPDAYLAAGNPECNPSSGVGCTSGRVDDSLVQLESPASNETERIDYIFVPPAPTCHIEAAGDPDADHTATGAFADRPNPFGAPCGPAPAPICWPSDHVGVQLDLNCG